MSSFGRTIQKRIMRKKGVQPVPVLTVERAVGYKLPLFGGQKFRLVNSADAEALAPVIAVFN
jgi:hypothetical protein